MTTHLRTDGASQDIAGDGLPATSSSRSGLLTEYPRPPKVLLYLVGIFTWPALSWVIMISGTPTIQSIYLWVLPVGFGVGALCILDLALPLWLRVILVLCYLLVAVAAFALVGVCLWINAGGWVVQ